MADWVLDASAALAMIGREPGADRVAELIADCLMTSVNAGEVVGRLVRSGAEPAAARLTTIWLPCAIVPLDRDLGLRAGELVRHTAPFDLSLGDRCCLALAEREALPAVTADRSWARLDLPVKVVLIR